MNDKEFWNRCYKVQILDLNNRWWNFLKFTSEWYLQNNASEIQKPEVCLQFLVSIRDAKQDSETNGYSAD